MGVTTGKWSKDEGADGCGDGVFDALRTTVGVVEGGVLMVMEMWGER